MISFFNGRKRTLGGGTSEVYAQVSVDFRDYLHLFKGARLGVFLAIALHTDKEGWAWPSYGLLARETGYSEDSIRRTLADLCALSVEGHRVLLRFQPYDDEEKRFASNRYLLFPSTDEVTRYESVGVIHLGAGTGGGFCSGGKIPPLPTSRGVLQSLQNAVTAKPHHEEEPSSEQEPAEEEEPEAAAGPSAFCSIHHVPMKLRQKDGETWYSHKAPDGQWCKGAPGDQPGQANGNRRTGARDRQRYGEWGGRRVAATCPACSLVRAVERICPDCGRCWDCCECEAEEEVQSE